MEVSPPFRIRPASLSDKATLERLIAASARELSQGDYPVYAAGVTHRGPYKDGPGELNVVVSIGGMVVRPGDLIAGDQDGVLAIPREDAERVIADAEAQNRKEQAAMVAIQAGTWDRKWVDETLKARGCDMGASK